MEVAIGVQQIATIIGGFCLFIYCSFKVYCEIFSKGDIFEKRKEKKRKEEKEVMEKILSEFFENKLEPIKNSIDIMHNKIDDEFNLLKKSTNDILRREINKIYYTYAPYKKIPQYDKQQLAAMVEDYFEQGGNSYVEGLWEEMKNWEGVCSLREIKELYDKASKKEG